MEWRKNDVIRKMAVYTGQVLKVSLKRVLSACINKHR